MLRWQRVGVRAGVTKLHSLGWEAWRPFRSRWFEVSCGAGDVQLTVPLGHAEDVRLVGAFVIDDSMAPPGSMRSNTKYTNAFAPSSSGEPQASAASRSACTAAPSSFRLRAVRCDSTPPPSKSCGHLQVSHTDRPRGNTAHVTFAVRHVNQSVRRVGRKSRTPPPAAARAQLHLYAVVPTRRDNADVQRRGVLARASAARCGPTGSH
jgi:hypothetical protein